jgi:hypothetical protein
MNLTRIWNVTVGGREGYKKYRVKGKKGGVVGELKAAIAQELGISPAFLCITEVQQSRIAKCGIEDSHPLLTLDPLLLHWYFLIQHFTTNYLFIYSLFS